ncbi:MAG TPA: GNAT family N-acetyltransferase [Marmoricola sp.]|nr:GNAT family N-acetyltransferase [Marmoricola sp.]
MTEHRIRVDRADDDDRYLATDETVWFAEVAAAPTEVQLVGLPAQHRFAADVAGSDPATYPGVYGVYPMTLAVPAADGVRRVSCAGLTWVGVHPDHRRKGVLTAMMRHHLEETHALGVHVSALHASEPAIYGRYGYGLASLEHEVTLARGTTLTAPYLEGEAADVTTRLATVSDPDVAARMHDCHARVAELGSVVGERAYYERICLQLPEHLRDKEPWRVLFARRAGVDVGFAMFRRQQKWEKARPAGDLSVWAMVGEPAARLTLLRRLLDFDLIGSVQVRTVGVADPMILWAGGPRATSDVATHDSLWVRLVDLPAALAQRSWSAPCDVVVEVADRDAPWNEGSWRIRADTSGKATVERVGTEAELRLRTEALGAAYLGGGNLVALHRAGLVDERRKGAVAELWRAMRTDVAPAAAFMF